MQRSSPQRNTPLHNRIQRPPILPAATKNQTLPVVRFVLSLKVLWIGTSEDRGLTCLTEIWRWAKVLKKVPKRSYFGKSWWVRVCNEVGEGIISWYLFGQTNCSDSPDKDLRTLHSTPMFVAALKMKKGQDESYVETIKKSRSWSFFCYGCTRLYWHVSRAFSCLCQAL